MLSEKVLQVANEYGYEVGGKTSLNRGVETWLKNNESGHEVYCGFSGAFERWSKSEEEIISEMKAGKPDYEAEFERMFG